MVLDVMSRNKLLFNWLSAGGDVRDEEICGISSFQFVTPPLVLRDTKPAQLAMRAMKTCCHFTLSLSKLFGKCLLLDAVICMKMMDSPNKCSFYQEGFLPRTSE